jgi:hypothetical protein
MSFCWLTCGLFVVPRSTPKSRPALGRPPPAAQVAPSPPGRSSARARRAAAAASRCRPAPCSPVHHQAAGRFYAPSCATRSRVCERVHNQTFCYQTHPVEKQVKSLPPYNMRAFVVLAVVVGVAVATPLALQTAGNPAALNIDHDRVEQGYNSSSPLWTMFKQCDSAWWVWCFFPLVFSPPVHHLKWPLCFRNAATSAVRAHALC